MKLVSVTINNFMAITEAQISLADRGLVLIQGSNEDESSAVSNGAGKSSIADAICWCLYGTTARGAEGDKVVNRTAGKDCFVKVEILDDTDHYEITRYRKHKTLKNNLVVTKYFALLIREDISKGTERLTQALINQILGCSYEVFTGAVYAGQERMSDLPGMTDKNLKMLIEEASGATLLEAAYTEAQTRLRAATREVEIETIRLAAADRAINDATTQVADAIKGREEFERLRLEAIRKTHGDAKTFKTSLTALTVELEKFDVRKFTEIIAAHDKSLAAVENEKKELIALNDAIAKAAADQAIIEREVRDGSFHLSRAIKEEADLDHKIGCPCKTCARPFSAADIEPAKRFARDAIAEFKSELSIAEKRLGAARSDVKKRTDARDKRAASMTDISATLTARKHAQDVLDEARNIERSVADYKAMIAAAVAAIKARQAEKNPFETRVVAANDALAKAKDELTAISDALDKAKQKAKIAELTAKVFSPAGVRAFLLDEVTPFLNDQTAKYLGTLSDGHITATWTTLVKTTKGELREKFSIEVSNSTGGSSFDLISGGEKRKVRIACALALQDLVARRATKPIDLFIGDEIDDALDTAGVERLTTILEEKARERGSVFIISHSDLKCWVRNTLIISKKDQRTTITESKS